jgi:hypothetical protein
MGTQAPPKKDKPAKAAKAEGGEKKPRAPRQDYGFAKDAKIALTDGEKTYRGKRAEMYEALKKSNGKTVEHFLENNKNEKDPPRGWLRFFVQNEACTLSGGTPPAKKEAKEAA